MMRLQAPTGVWNSHLRCSVLSMSNITETFFRLGFDSSSRSERSSEGTWSVEAVRVACVPMFRSTPPPLWKSSPAHTVSTTSSVTPHKSTLPWDICRRRLRAFETVVTTLSVLVSDCVALRIADRGVFSLNLVRSLIFA